MLGTQYVQGMENFFTLNEKGISTVVGWAAFAGAIMLFISLLFWIAWIVEEKDEQKIGT